MTLYPKDEKQFQAIDSEKLLRKNSHDSSKTGIPCLSLFPKNALALSYGGSCTLKWLIGLDDGSQDTETNAIVTDVRTLSRNEDKSGEF